MTEKSQKADKRIQHTKRFLKNALVELLKEKPLAQITVTELCQRATINRNTFYCHYGVPGAILSEMEEEIASRMRSLLEREISKTGTMALVLEICKLLKENPDSSYIILNADDRLYDRLSVFCYDKNIGNWKQLADAIGPVTAERFFAFSLSGATTIIREWCNHGFEESPEEIAEFIGELSLFGMQGLIARSREKCGPG